MTFALIVSSDKYSLLELAKTLEKNDVDITWAESSSDALSMTSNTMFDLIIADEFLENMTGLEFIKKIVPVNPMLNCAVVSSLSQGDFHEASEGLGILMQLPVQLKEKDADELLQRLKTILNLTHKTGAVEK
ncbi:MAG: response regulator [Deltaproteobacteria bacterium]|nr:response regulator [Deltaproteobacteria bacterium]